MTAKDRLAGSNAAPHWKRTVLSDSQPIPDFLFGRNAASLNPPLTHGEQPGPMLLNGPRRPRLQKSDPVRRIDRITSLIQLIFIRCDFDVRPVQEASGNKRKAVDFPSPSMALLRLDPNAGSLSTGRLMDPPTTEEPLAFSVASGPKAGRS